MGIPLNRHIVFWVGLHLDSLLISNLLFVEAEGEVDLVEMLLSDIRDGKNLRRLKPSHERHHHAPSVAPPPRER